MGLNAITTHACGLRAEVIFPETVFRGGQQAFHMLRYMRGSNLHIGGLGRLA